MPPYKIKHTGFYDKSFQEKDTEYYVLTASIAPRSFTISLYNPENRLFTGLETFPAGELKKTNTIAGQLDILLKKRPWLNSSFYKINLIFSNDLNTLIPLPLFDEKEKLAYLRFNHPGQKNNSVEYDILKNMQMANVYFMPVRVINKAIEIWPEVKFYHFSSVLIESLGINFKNQIDDHTLFVNLRDEVFDVVNFREGRLNFYNSFRFKAVEDFIYFLLAAIEQLKLNPEEARIVLSGNIDKTGPKYEMVYRYIRHFEFIERNETFHYSYAMEELNFAKYYVEFNVIQCG